MGGTDITCGISGLPIATDEPMRFIFLRQPDPEYVGGMHWHPWAKWLPISLPVKGTYNFYGMLHDLEPTPLIKLTAEVIGRYALPLPDPEDAEGRPPLDKYPHTIESLMKACERGYLSIEIPPRKDDDDEPTIIRSKISPFYVSEEMYQTCIHNIEDEGRGISTFRTRLTPREGEKPGGALRSAHEWPQKRAEMQELNKEHGVGLDDDFLNTFGLRDLTSNMEATPDILGCGTNWKPDVSDLKSLAEFGDDDWKQFDEESLGIRVFDYTLRINLRREWYPTLALGQYHFPNDELISHRMLARKIEEQALAIEGRYLEANPDYGDEDGEQDDGT